ncbi:pyridoxal phosphate-dependent decarboxylase family protein [Nocardia transvalensis]|uniref:pyridoxal phosphate-dependent decarboxylase family protein n=1 Tax=Nocardia transvalensis TaxID=37333 RepID=UPI0018960959|nr:pyridoxal-dependent decarboxylase [Nocardia transvalensis]MBF6332654.1 diaminobutyrate decarboxylase [Nocardia transvalensis]
MSPVDIVDDMREVGTAVLETLATHIESVRTGSGDVVSAADIEWVSKRLELRRWVEEGGMTLPELLSFVTTYSDLSASHHHPGYMAHQIAPSDTPGVVADLLQAVTNNIPLVYELAPAAAAVDRAVCRWMLDHLGWAETGTGAMTNGGSLGNLTALLAARSHADATAWRDGNPGDLVVLAPATSHYSVRKAAAVMGLGERGVHPLPTDELGRIDPAGLAPALAAVRAQGRRPIAVVANGCATGTGLYDPVAEVAEFCERNDLWFHLDGAHGAAALISPRLRGRLAGIERADSTVWDGHKMLRTSALCTGVLFREKRYLDTLFKQDASYLYRPESEDVDPGQFTFETSKAPLGLKILLTLAYRGQASLRSYVERQYDLATHLWTLIQDRPDFTAPYRPQSNILCFRYEPWGDRQLELRSRLIQDGRFYLSSFQLAGTPYLRASLMSPTTDHRTLTDLLEAIVEVAAE